jgi:hypothetical protein
LPELWSGIVKENILFAPGANSSTVMVVIICRKENSGYSISPQPTESIQPPCHRIHKPSSYLKYLLKIQSMGEM